MRKLALVLGAVLLVAGTASAQETQLDISGGFTMDAWCGAPEYQTIQNYAYDYLGPWTPPDLDMAELQGGYAQGRGNNVVAGGEYLVCNIDNDVGETMGMDQDRNDDYLGYAIDDNWYRPGHVTGTEGTPEDGVLAGADRDYHIASHLGNATLAGDWTGVADPSSGVGWGGYASGAGMAVKLNCLVVRSSHATDSHQIIEAVAELPAPQKLAYNNINFVLTACREAQRARYMRIVALYGDGTDEVELWAFSDTAADGQRAQDNDGGADWQIVYTYDETYTNDSGATGAVGAYEGSMYEFKEPLALDPAKTLWGIKVYDAHPTITDQARGIVIFAATAFAAGPAGDPDPAQCKVEADPDVIPDDESVPSVVTVTLKDSNQSLLTGYEGKIDVSISGAGVSSVTAFSVVSDGVYEADFTNDTAGDKVVNVTVDMDPAGAGPEDIPLPDAPTVTVVLTGVPPVADAGADQWVEDAGGSGDEDVTLDGSGSFDPDGTIVSYSWAENGEEIAVGVNPEVTLAVGAHLITLTVTDDNPMPSFTDSDDLWVTVYAQGLDPDNIVELDISSGFNFDVICGALEWQAVKNYAAAYDPNKDLKELQGKYAEGVGWSALGGSYMFICATSEGGFGEPYSIWSDGSHPIWKNDDRAGLPEDGTIMGGSVAYHTASHLGNPTLPGDWTEVASPTAGPPESIPNMESVSNAMYAFSGHSTSSSRVTTVTATLPIGQQAQYAGINFVLGAASHDEGAMNQQIVAIYDDASEDILYSFPTEDPDFASSNRWGPCFDDNLTDMYDPDEFNVVETGTQLYNSGSGTMGSPGSARDHSLFEFAAPLLLDDTKVLAGIRIEDVDPSRNNHARGLTILAASTVYEIPPEGWPPEVSVATEDGLDWVYQNIPASVGNGGHKVALTVTVIDLNGNNTVTVTVTKQAASGPGEVTVQPGATDLEKEIHGSDRTAGTSGFLILEVSCQGDVAADPTVFEVPFWCNIIGDIDGNGGGEPTDVSLLINKLNGLGNGGFHDKAFDLDANGGPEPGDVSILINVLNGLL